MSNHNFPHEAVAIIDKVLHIGSKKYPSAYWRTLSVKDHVDRASRHLHDYIYGVETNEDSLAHALTRLAMAVAVREWSPTANRSR